MGIHYTFNQKYIFSTQKHHFLHIFTAFPNSYFLHPSPAFLCTDCPFYRAFVFSLQIDGLQTLQTVFIIIKRCFRKRRVSAARTVSSRGSATTSTATNSRPCASPISS